MSKFEGNDFNIREEEAFSKAPRVVKTSQPVERTVQDFRMTDLKPQASAPARPAVRQAARPAASAPGDGKRDQRFMISHLARDALSIGREEERLVERRVEEKLNELSEKTREQAFAQGHAEGLKQGHAEASQAFQVESAQRLEQLDRLMQSMESAKSELFESNREFLMNVVYRVSKAVLLRELGSDKEYLLRLARELIERCGLRENLTLKINPSDAGSIDMLKQGLVQSFSSLRNLTIELSDHVTQGGCILETEWSAIDASLETQLSQVLSSLDAPKGATV